VFFVTLQSDFIFVMQSTDSHPQTSKMKQRPKVTAIGRQVRRACLALALLCACFPIGAQGGFEKSFGGPKDDFGRAVLQTKDHGYLEVGGSEGVLGDDNDFDIFVVRTDVDGTIVWSKTYDEGYIEQGTDVIQDSDTSFLIVGFQQATINSEEQTLLLRINRKGEKLLTVSYGEAGSHERGRQLIRIPGNGFLITGYRQDIASGRNSILVTKINDLGQIEWRSTFGDYRSGEAVGAVAGNDGTYIIGANIQDFIGVDSDIALYGLDADGELLWTKLYGTTTENEQIEDIIRTQDDQLVFVGSTDGFNKALIAKADLNGDTLWYRQIDAAPFDDELRGVIEEDGGENLVAVGQTVPTGANLDVLMVKVRSSDGQLLWQRRLGDDDALDVAEDLAPTLDGGYALAAFNSRGTVLFNDMTLFKTDNLGDLQTNYLRGKVYHPSNSDCAPFQDGDLGLEGWLVRAESSTATFFGSTDSLGNYDLRVDRGVYSLSLLRKNDRWDLCSPAPLTVDLTEPYDSNFHDFALNPAIDCPLLEVAVSATPAIQCEDQTLTVTFGNSGAATSTDSRVELNLDPNLTFVEAEPAPTAREGQLLSFSLGDLEPGTTGTITIRVQTACDGVVEGQALQTTANVYPIYDCSPIDPDWDGSSIVVTGRCDPETGLAFEITNVGDNPMTQVAGYVVVEDIVLLQRSTFILGPSESRLIEVNLQDGPLSTYRLIAEQSPGHPGNLFPTVVVEGCNVDEGQPFTTGQVAQFPDNDGNLNIDILTQEIVALDDGAPVSLRAYPRGYRDSIIIPKTDIEYTIFFAPPANDIFERVVIRDTLPEELDFNSLEMGAASHPYDFVLYQDGILKITFDSIRIFSGGGAGEADAALNRGYVSFRLSQKPNTTRGAVIRNRAAVYFDYETPTFSEEVTHVVGCDNFFEVDCLLTTTTRNLPRATGVELYLSPNPAIERTTVRLEGWTKIDTEFTFRLFSASGQTVHEQRFRGDQMEFLRHKLAAGNYFYEVTGGGYLIGSGSLILP
jgi:hypothetical protein